MKSEPYERERAVSGKSEDLQNNIGDDAKDAVISSNNNNLKNFSNLSRDDARNFMSGLLKNGEISIDDLKEIIPENVNNTFIPTITIKNEEKYEFFLSDNQKVIIRWHEPDPIAASKYPGCISESRYTAEIKVGNKQLKSNGDWSKNQSTNEVHIPIIGK